LEEKMPISQTEFEGLDPKRHVVIDAEGKIWTVHSNEENSGERVPGNREVVLSRNTGDPTYFGWKDGDIVDEIGIDVALNHPTACIQLQNK
jgi:hypothetical protein